MRIYSFFFGVHNNEWGCRYNHAPPSHVVSRLTSRNLHLLALRISTFLLLKPDMVLKHWASAKILRSKPSATGTGKDAELTGDDEVCKLIVDKFQQLGGTEVSYADIAKRAWEVGRSGLATKVCENSSSTAGRLLMNYCRLSCLIMNPGHQTKCLCFSP